MAQVTASLTTTNGTPATGISDACLVKDGIVRLSGTFSATIQVMVDALGDGTWAPATDSTGAALSLTTPGAMRIGNGIACPTRVECTAYTSGTIAVAIRSN